MELFEIIKAEFDFKKLGLAELEVEESPIRVIKVFLYQLLQLEIQISKNIKK
jgi:hypothetical protein